MINVQGLEDYSRPAMLVIEVNISPFNPLDPTERTTLLGGKGVRTKTLKLTAAINRNNQITDFVSSNNARNVSLAQACAQLPGLGGAGGNEGVWDPGWDNAGLGAAFLPPEDARCLAFVGEGTLVPPLVPIRTIQPVQLDWSLQTLMVLQTLEFHFVPELVDAATHSLIIFVIVLIGVRLAQIN
jgi:hypothetical protein